MKIKLKEIIDFVNHDLDLDMNKRTRTRDVIYARTLYYKLAKEHTKQSLASIGKPLRKDHATVLHGLNKVWHNAVLHGEYIEDCYNRFNRIVKLAKAKEEKEAAPAAISYLQSDDFLLLESKIEEQERKLFLLQEEELTVRNNRDRVSRIISSLRGDDRKVEEFFFRAEAMADMIGKAVYQ
jgi:hypothetical protein